MKKPTAILLFFLFVANYGYAQKFKMANHLFENRAYVDASKLFLRIRNKTQDDYEKLADSYYYNTDLTEAAKWYQKLMENHEDTVEAIYFFRYAQALVGLKKFDDAKLWFKKYNNSKVTDGDPVKIDFNSLLNTNTKSSYTIYPLDFNTEESDFGGAFLKNKLVFVSTRSGGKEYKWNKLSYLDLYEADIGPQGNLNNLVPFSSSINTELHDSNAVFTKDGKTMYFTRNNYIEGATLKDKKETTQLKIYKAELVDGDWINIEELWFNSDNYSVMHPALSDDEKKLYFSSDMPGSIGMFDLFVVDVIDHDTYGKPKNLGSKINTEQLEQFPFYSSDTLYFSTNGHLGFGGLDIFKTAKTKKGFTDPENLKIGVNSSFDDFGYVINDDTNTGYISSNREGGKGEDDIYKFVKKRNSKVIVNGLVKSSTTSQTLAMTQILLIDENDTIIEELQIGREVTFQFLVDPNMIYKIRANSRRFEAKEIVINTNTNNNPMSIELVLELED